MNREGFSIQSAKLNVRYEDILELIPGGADIFLIEDEVTGKYMVMITPESQGAGLPYYTDILLNVINLIGEANVYGYRFQKNNQFGGGDIVVVLNLDIQ
jgi:hypothetical protein